MNHEERGASRRDAVDRRCRSPPLSVVHRSALHHTRLEIWPQRTTVVLEEIVHPVERDTRLSRHIGILEPRLQRGVVSSECCQCGKVAPGRSSRNRDEAGIDTQRCGIGPHPGDRPLYIDEVVRVGGFRTEPIRGSEDLPPGGGEAMDHRASLRVPSPPPPAAAVYVHQRRTPDCVRGTPDPIEDVTLVRPIGDTGVNGDIVWKRGTRSQQRRRAGPVEPHRFADELAYRRRRRCVRSQSAHDRDCECNRGEGEQHLARDPRHTSRPSGDPKPDEQTQRTEEEPSGKF